MRPFAAFIHRTKETDKLLETLDAGTHLLAQGPRVLRALRELDAEEGRAPVSPEQAKQFLRLSAHAKEVLRTKSAGLFSMALTQLWSQLEVLVEDFVVGRVQERPELVGAADMRVRVRLAEWLGLDDNQRCKQAVRATIKNGPIGSLSGAQRLEAMLALAGLPGRLPSSLGRKLTELHQLRNVLVHRGGVIDEHFKRSCPWTRQREGQALAVTMRRFTSYADAVQLYVLLILRRLAAEMSPRASGKPRLPNVPERESQPGPSLGGKRHDTRKTHRTTSMPQ
jgi:hypothetical protein